MKYLLTAAAALVAFPAAAQEASPQGAGVEDVRINQLIVYGDDVCPASTDTEIIICARKGEGERYRIPENLRDNQNDPAGRSWADRALELQYVGRSGIGSCSPVGSGGVIGCFNQLVTNARAERATRDSVNWNRLIEEARQERLSRIDAAAAEEEAESQSPR
jgi:hypothetical protein